MGTHVRSGCRTGRGKRPPEVTLSVIHHRGWGTYYFEFYDDESEFLFALSEAGHIAGLGSLVFSDDKAQDAVNDFNLRDEVLAGTTQKQVNSSLQNRYSKLCEIAKSH